MKINKLAVVEMTKGGAVHVRLFDDEFQAKSYYDMCDNARGCHCKSKEECKDNIIHSKFEIVILRGETKIKKHPYEY